MGSVQLDVDLSVVGPQLSREAAAFLARSGALFEHAPALLEARGEFTLSSRAGLTPALLERLWVKRTEAEAIIASRYVRGARGGSLASRWVNRLSRRLVDLPCFDRTSSTHLYRTSALRRSLSGEPASAAEVLVYLVNAGFKLKEVAWESVVGPESLGSHLAALPRLARLRRDRSAADADDRWHRRHRRRMDERQAAIVGFLEVDVPVLDVGCGSSRLVQTLSKGTGVDRDPAKIRFLRGRSRAAVCGDLKRLPFRSGSFPQLVLADVPYEDEDVAELKRVLTPRGTLVIAAPVSASSDVGERLARQGFAVDEVRRVGRERILRAVRQ